MVHCVCVWRMHKCLYRAIPPVNRNWRTEIRALRFKGEKLCNEKVFAYTFVRWIVRHVGVSWGCPPASSAAIGFVLLWIRVCFISVEVIHPCWGKGEVPRRVLFFSSSLPCSSEEQRGKKTLCGCLCRNTSQTCHLHVAHTASCIFINPPPTLDSVHKCSE